MRTTILGFDQIKVTQIEKQINGKLLKLDMTDLLLLDYIERAAANPSMQRFIDEEDNLCYVWLLHSKILEDLPILDIKVDALNKRLRKLIDLELLTSKVITNNNGRGSKSFYGLTEKTIELKQTTTCKKLQVKDEPDVKNYSCSDGPAVKNYRSNNKLTNNNKLNKDSISKDIHTCNFNFGSSKNTKESKKTLAERFVQLYTEHCPSLGKVKKLNDNRIRLISKLYKEYSEQEIITVLKTVEDSDFLKGKTGTWKATFDWIIKDSNFIKIYEGNYNNSFNKQKDSLTSNRFIGQHTPQVDEEIVDEIY